MNIASERVANIPAAAARTYTRVKFFRAFAINDAFFARTTIIIMLITAGTQANNAARVRATHLFTYYKVRLQYLHTILCDGDHVLDARKNSRINRRCV